MTDVRYQRSLTSVFEGGSSSSSTVDTRNHEVAVTMGIVYSAVGGFW